MDLDDDELRATREMNGAARTEDIKILEEKLKQWESYKNIKFKTDIELDIQKENRAIENLINRNKELEEILKHKNDLIKQADKDLETDYIPKSKIKEKIEELTNTKGDFATYIATSERIRVLQELLEE